MVRMLNYWVDFAAERKFVESKVAFGVQTLCKLKRFALVSAWNRFDEIKMRQSMNGISKINTSKRWSKKAPYQIILYRSQVLVMHRMKMAFSKCSAPFKSLTMIALFDLHDKIEFRYLPLKRCVKLNRPVQHMCASDRRHFWHSHDWF